MRLQVSFDPEFDKEKIRKILPYLPATYEAFHEIAPWVRDWPTHFEAMPESYILEGRARGAGHGMYMTHYKRIFMNPHMSALGIWLNILHESMHHAFPDATETEINQVLVPHLAKRITGKKLDPELARLHGLGPPAKGIVGRGYSGQ